MKQVLEDLWNGNIRPCEKCGVGETEIEELLCYIQRHKESLEQNLNEQQNIMLKKYLDCWEEYRYLVVVSAFGEGFGLGMRLAAEAFVCGR